MNRRTQALAPIGTYTPSARLALTALVVAGLAWPQLARASNAPQQEVTRAFTDNRTLAAGQGLRLENTYGDVTLRGQAGREVKISATIRVSADSREEADSFAKQIHIEVQPNANGITIRTVYPEVPKSSWFGHKNISYSVSYDVAMPTDATLTVRNNFGNASVVGVRGYSDIGVSHGSLSARDLGPGRLANSFGGIELTGAAGDVSITDNNGEVRASGVQGALELTDRFGSVVASNVSGRVSITNGNGNIELTESGGPSSVTTSFGHITARNIRGDLTVRDTNGAIEVSVVAGAADLATRFGSIDASHIKKGARAADGNGNITFSDIEGDANAQTSFGRVDVQRLSGSLTAETMNGSILAREVKGDVFAKTSFAGVDLAGIGGRISAESQNGAVQIGALAASACKDISAKTSFGPIQIHLPENLGYNITAHTSFGSVKSELPITTVGTLNSDSITGKIGNGGCELQLSTNNSNIEILRGK